MAANKVRGDYEQLNQIAQAFTQQADAIRQTLTSIKGAESALEGGHWVGKGADKFYQEMQTAVLPSLNRLTAALDKAAQVTGRISQIIKQAENDCAALFKIQAGGGLVEPGGGSPAGQSSSGSSSGGSGILGSVMGALGKAAGFVGDLFVGAGSELLDMVKGIGNIIIHPIDTLKGLAYGITHPGQLWDAFTKPYVEDWNNGHPGRAIGRGLIFIGSFFVGAGEAKAVGTAGEAGELAAKAGKLGEVAAEAGKVGEVAAEAGKVGEVAAEAGKVGEIAAEAGKVGEVAAEAGKVGDVAAGAGKAGEVAAGAGKGSEAAGAAASVAEQEAALAEAAKAGEGAKAAEGAGAAGKAGEAGEGADVMQSGGQFGSHSDPVWRWEEYAPKAYDEIRSATTDVRQIANSSGFSEAEIQAIKNHVFENEHILDDGLRRFDADPDIADAWARLQKGEHLPEDIDLLKHELYEAQYELAHGSDYRTAHQAALDAGFTWKPPVVK